MGDVIQDDRGMNPVENYKKQWFICGKITGRREL